MADRGAHRGGRGQHRGGRGGRGGAAGGEQKEKPKKENILDLNKYMDKRITVKFSGGREGMIVLLGCVPGVVTGLHSLTHKAATGCLKGHDALMNLVLDDVQETVRGRCCS